jgi:hypothetical protein
MITNKLLSSQHKRKVNDVIMSFFLTAPRSCYRLYTHLGDVEEIFYPLGVSLGGK